MLLLGQRVRPSTDLKILSKLRNEIVHFLPYAQDITAQTVPDWLQYLEQQDLLITSNGEADFHFSQKLGSYGIAYWACATAHEAVAKFATEGVSSPIGHFVTPNNFGVTGGIHSPEELLDFDKQYGLNLT